MDEGNEVATFPVANQSVVAYTKHQVILMRLGFLSHAMQKDDEADPGRIYALSPAGARNLAQSILKALDEMESAPFETPPDRH